MARKTTEPSAVDEHIGQRIQLRRVMLGMSQKTLAEKCGITFQQIQKYETAGNRISASRLFDLSLALETPVSFFYYGLPGFVEHDICSLPPSRQRVCDQDDNDPLYRNESLYLINLYWRMADDEQRQLITRLLQIITGCNTQ